MKAKCRDQRVLRIERLEQKSLLTGAGTGLWPHDGGAILESIGMLVIESESTIATEQSNRYWQEMHDPSAANHAYLVTEDEGIAAGVAERTARIYVDTPGRYYVWVRAKATHSGNDSINIGIAHDQAKSIEQGDYDLNRVVDEADLSVWRINYGTSLNLNADGNKDGIVDTADYTIWRDRKGTSVAPSTRASASASGISLSRDGNWKWNNVRMSSFGGGRAYIDFHEAGSHELLLAMREDGAAVDQIVLTRDGDFVPSGAVGVAEPANSIFVVEAEAASGYSGETSREWQLVSDPLASGAKAVAVSDLNNSDPARLHHYLVNVEQPGVYYVWVRGRASNSSNDSVNIGLDGVFQPTSAHIGLQRSGEWEWNNQQLPGYAVQEAYLTIDSPGIHYVTLGMREDGAEIDQILLTTNAGVRPYAAVGVDAYSGDILQIEAEEPDLRHGANRVWEEFIDSGASAGSAVRVADEDLSSDAPTNQYLVYVSTPGRYYVGVRGRATSGGNDSVHIGLDGVLQDTATHLQLLRGGDWEWSTHRMDRYGGQLAYLDIQVAGLHTVDLAMREDGAEVDKLVLTRLEEFAARVSGFGEADPLRLGLPEALSDPTPTHHLVTFDQGGYWRDGTPETTNTFAQFGLDGDQAVSGDFNGDGVWELAIFRGDINGLGWWYIDWDHNGYNGELPYYQFGFATDQAIAGDFDGDGIWEIGTYREEEGGLGWWYIDWDNNGYNGEVAYQQFGFGTDQAAPGDFDGDGVWELAVMRGDSEGLGWWFIDWDHNGYNGETPSYQFGFGTDQAVTADFDGDGVYEIATYRIEASGLASWYVDLNHNGYDGEIPYSNFGTPFSQAVPFPVSREQLPKEKSVTVVVRGLTIDFPVIGYGGPLSTLVDPLYDYYAEQGTAGKYTYAPASGALTLTEGTATPQHRVIMFDWEQGGDILTAAPGDDEAAGDALFAMLVEHDLLSEDSYLHLIGYSRGGVVASEAAQRILAHGYSLDHLTYLDSEPGLDEFIVDFPTGNAGGEVAWQGAGFIDAYRTEEVIQTHGDELSGAHNEQILGLGLTPEIGFDFLAHNDMPVWYAQTIASDFSEHSFQEGFFWRRNTALQSAASVSSGIAARVDPTVQSPPALFNGDFEYGKTSILSERLAGWEEHGGSGSSTVELRENASNSFVRIDEAADLTHSRGYVPPSSNSLRYDIRVPESSDTHRLAVSAILADGQELLIDSLLLATLADIPLPEGRLSSTSWHSRQVPLPEGIAGQVVRLRVSVRQAKDVLGPGDPASVAVDFDNLTFTTSVSRTLEVESIRRGDRVSFTETDQHVFVDRGGGPRLAYRKSLLSELIYRGSRGEDVVENHTSLPLAAWTGDGRDTVVGGSADDYLHSGGGDDDVRGGAGNDYLNGHHGRNYLSGGDGNDRIHAWFDDDTISGDAGNDIIYASDGNDSIDGGSGDDEIYGQEGNDQVFAGEGNDTVWGGGGNDAINGHSGNNVIYGEGGNDFLQAWFGADRIFGGDGDDEIYADAGNDEIDAGDGKDYISSGPGSDRVLGGDGDDTIDLSGSGDNYVVAGRGGDNVRFMSDSVGTQVIVAADPNAHLTLDFSRLPTAISIDLAFTGRQSVAANGLVIDLRSDDLVSAVVGTAYSDRVLGNRRSNQIFGGDGDDELVGGDGFDKLYGQGGSDYLHGGYGNDLLDGGAGFNSIVDTYGINTFYLGGRGHLVQRNWSNTLDGVRIDELGLGQHGRETFVDGGFLAYYIDSREPNAFLPLSIWYAWDFDLPEEWGFDSVVKEVDLWTGQERLVDF